MSDKYYDLFDLLEEDVEAGDYFSDLPQYVQDMIEDRADSVRNIDELKSYADNLLSGDK